MINITIELILIALSVAVSTSIVGTFLMLRGIALMSDAISHAIVLGIICMFLVTKQLHSPLLIVGATAAGMLTVMITEHIIQTRRIKKDAAIGLVYPLFFSLGVILTSYFARNVHIDTDMVLLGELAFAPFDRIIYNGFDLGPSALWTMGTITFLVIFVITLLWKELTLATFDATQSYLQGFKPQLLYYLLMLLTNITVVGAFNVVGSIVVVALMVCPPASAYLVCNRLENLVFTALLFGCTSATLGCLFALSFDLSIAGMIASVNGLLFAITLCIRNRFLRKSFANSIST